MDGESIIKTMATKIQRLRNAGVEMMNLYLNRDTYQTLAESSRPSERHLFMGLNVYYKIDQEEAFKID